MAQEFTAELGRGIQMNQSGFDGREMRSGRVKYYNLAFPFWIKEIPVRFDLSTLNELGVKAIERLDFTVKSKDVFTFLVDIIVFAFFPPLGGMDNLRENESWADRIQDFLFVEREERAGSGNDHIANIF